MFTLKTPAGSYQADSLASLLWLVLTHRAGHLLRGDGWVD